MTHRDRFRQGLLSATVLAGLSAAAPAAAQEQEVAAAPAAAQDQQAAVPAPAQEQQLAAATVPAAAAQDSGGSDDIVVTATRRSVSLQDVPINISAIGGETLDRQRLDDVADIAAFTPGLTVIDNGAQSANRIVLRGISAAETGVFGTDRDTAVGVYLGEVPLYLDFKLLDLERVETLLGPQGTLYGLGTLAGAIRYIPNRPDMDDWGLEVHGRVYDVSRASSPGVQADAVVNIPILQDRIAFRSVVGWYDDPGFIDYPFLVRQLGVSLPQPDFTDPDAVRANLFRRKDLNDERTFTTRNALGFKFDPFRFTATYIFQRTNTTGRQANGGFGVYPDGRGVLGTGRYEAPQRVPEPSDRKSQLISGELEVDIGDFAQIVSATAYSKQDNFSRSDVTDLLLDLDYDYELFPAFAGFTQSDTDRKQFNQELRLVSTHEGPFSWVLGGFYNKFETFTFSAERFPGLPEFLGIFRPDGLEYISFTDSTTKEYAAFGEATFRVTPAWQVTGGLRYYKYKAEITGATDTPLTGGGIRRTPFPLVQFDPSRVRSGDTKDDGFVYKINTSYEFSPELLVYATYSTGYRIGGANRVAPCIQPLPPGQNVCALPNELFFGPDKTKNKEIGVRFTSSDRRFQGTISAFHIDWKDLQLGSQTANGAVGITINASEAISKGIEATFSARFGQFTLGGNYSYNDAKLSKDAPDLIGGLDQSFIDADPLVNDAFDGDRLPGSTKHSGSLTGTYTLPLANEAELTAQWTTTYIGSILSKTGARGFGEKIPDYSVSRASLSYGRGPYEFTVFANNIFNKYAITSVAQDRSEIGVNDGVDIRYFGYGVLRPRVIGVEGRLKF